MFVRIFRGVGRLLLSPDPYIDPYIRPIYSTINGDTIFKNKRPKGK